MTTEILECAFHVHNSQQLLETWTLRDQIVHLLDRMRRSEKC